MTTESNPSPTPPASLPRPSERAPSPYRLLISDIDGTLLDSTGSLRATTIAATQRARAAGIVVTLATGRRFATTVDILTELGLLPGDAEASAHPLPTIVCLPPIVLQGGAVVASTDGTTVFYRNPLARDQAMLAARILIDMGLQPIVYDDRVHEQRLFTGPDSFDNAATAQYLSRHRHTVERRPYESWNLTDDPLQLAVIGPREPLHQAAARLISPGCRVIISESAALDAHFMEVFHQLCDKASAALHVANLLGFGLAETVCIGDNWNDVEMMARAGCGIAVANAPKDVLPFARRLTVSNDEDAVQVVLDQLLAGEEPGIPNPHYDPAHFDRYLAAAGAHAS
ncbi:MAG TPA: HAD hydrolase family protein [Chloroflexota bacterium]